MLDRVTLKDHVTAESLLLMYNLPSVNQLAAEIKLTETWKSINIQNYPFKLEPNNHQNKMILSKRAKPPFTKQAIFRANLVVALYANRPLLWLLALL